MRTINLFFVISILLYFSLQVSGNTAEVGTIISTENASGIEPYITIQAEQLEFVLDVTISNDNSMLILRNSFDSSLMELWNLETSLLQSIITPLRNESIWNVEFGNNDTVLAIQQDNFIQVWDTNNSSTIASVENNYSQMSLLSMDSILAFTTTSNDRLSGGDFIYLWDYLAQVEVAQLEHSGAFIFDMNHNDTRLISGSVDGSVRLWDISSITEPSSQFTIRNGDGQRIFELGFIDDDLLFFTLFDDSSFNLWNYRTNNAVEPRYETASMVGKTLFQTRLTDNSHFQIWDASSNMDLIVLNAPDNQLIDVTSDLKVGVSINTNGVSLLDLHTGEILKSINMNCDFGCSASLNHTDDYLVTWGENNIVTVWAIPE